MGKKDRRKKKVSASGKPFVSICTPTYNRRKFIPQLIECYKQQTYPSELMEWIVVDDGEDSVEDLFKDIPGVKYFRIEEKMKLGRKRNFMHDIYKIRCKRTNDILTFFNQKIKKVFQRVEGPGARGPFFRLLP